MCVQCEEDTSVPIMHLDLNTHFEADRLRHTNMDADRNLNIRFESLQTELMNFLFKQLDLIKHDVTADLLLSSLNRK